MHTEIRYDTKNNPMLARDRAIADLIDWLGQAKYDELTPQFKAMKNDGMNLGQFRMWVSLAGVTGYPVEVWYDKL